MGFAEEDDKIDAMLPSRKRHSSSVKYKPRKRGRIGSSSLFRATNKPYARQPKITEHLNRSQHPRHRGSKQVLTSGSVPRRQGQGSSGHPRKPAPPRLSILDMVHVSRHFNQDVPQFIKIAARTARSRLGRESKALPGSSSV